MAALTYSAFGELIGNESPYDRKNSVEFVPGFANTEMHGTDANPLSLQWDFRHKAPWSQEPGAPKKPIKVQNYPIVKAMLIPYFYKRRLLSGHGGTASLGSTTQTIAPGSEVALKIETHLLVGYTQAVVPTDQEITRPPAETGTTTYASLGKFIKAETPKGADPELLADPARRSLLELAVTWLADLSAQKFGAGEDRLISTSDEEMDLIQEQQCLNWDFPLDLAAGSSTPSPNQGLTPAGTLVSAEVPPPPPFGSNWMRNFQVTKAIRATYEVMAPDPNNPSVDIKFRGDVLVGFSGGGGM